MAKIPLSKKAQATLYKAKKRAEIKRYKTQTKNIARKGKVDRFVRKTKARNQLPIETQKLKTGLAKHVTWATTVSNIAGKASTATNSNAANQNQNILGGLSDTINHRDDDEKDEAEGGVVY